MESPAILYVEDDDNDVFLFQRAFTKAGSSHLIHVVTDGLCAIEYMTGEGRYANRTVYPLPKLMVVDLKMPRMSGFELLNWVRQRPRFSKLPFVLLSSSNYSTDIHAAFVQGANGYLVKPSDSSELIQRLRDLVVTCEGCNFEADGWLSFLGNQPLASAGRGAIPLVVKGPFPGVLNITARHPEN